LQITAERRPGKEGSDQGAEHERDEQLPGADDDDPPDRGRAADGECQREERVDADERRQVGEAEGEVRPEAHGTVELVLVAEDLEVLAVAEFGGLRGF